MFAVYYHQNTIPRIWELQAGNCFDWL